MCRNLSYHQHNVPPAYNALSVLTSEYAPRLGLLHLRRGGAGEIGGRAEDEEEELANRIPRPGLASNAESESGDGGRDEM